MASNRVNAAWLRLLLTTLAFATLALLGGCGGGSGAPNNPFAPGPVTPGPLSILPSAPTVYSNTPTTLNITGGVPPYFVVSSNTAVLPLGASVTNGTIVLLPGNVLSDTGVTITVQDSAGTKANATVTVKPAPIFNTLTITPAGSCGSSGSGAGGQASSPSNVVCSGQTAIAQVTVTGPGGVGLPGRQVRFDVVSGPFAIETTDPANPLVSSLTVVSDQFGVAQVIIQAAPGAPTQSALLRATELTSGNQQTVQFTILQTINGSAVLSVVPPTATITGAFTDECSTGFRIDYYIYGGTPPYQVTSTFPGAVTLVNSTVLASGQPFTAITNGTCVNPLIFSIVDATGLETTAQLINNPGTASPTPTPPPTLQVVPGSLTSTTSCAAATFPEFIIGGSPPYNIFATPTGPTFSTQVVKVSGGEVDISAVPTGTTTFTVIDSGSQGLPQQSVTFTITCP